MIAKVSYRTLWFYVAIWTVLDVVALHFGWLEDRWLRGDLYLITFVTMIWITEKISGRLLK